MSESRTGGPLDAALQRLGNAVACVSSRDYPHVVADGTMALREVELGVEALRTALRPRMAFFEKCWDAARDAQEIGGDDIQEWGEQLGLLKAVRVTEPCGEGCWCAEYVGNDFPAECLRLVPIPDGVGAPERDESGEAPQP